MRETENNRTSAFRTTGARMMLMMRLGT